MIRHQAGKLSTCTAVVSKKASTKIKQSIGPGVSMMDRVLYWHCSLILVDEKVAKHNTCVAKGVCCHGY